jgi:hypothetical protein
LFKIFFVCATSILFNFVIVFIFNKKVLTYLFWINFYLFMIIFAFSQFSNFSIDLFSKYNPFGGLFLTIIYH